MSSENEIVTQHFDDPIGSLMEIDGECYVKISNKEETPISVLVEDVEELVYYPPKIQDGEFEYESFDFESEILEPVPLVSPPLDTDLYTIGCIHGRNTIRYNHFLNLPTELAYVQACYSFTRNITRIVVELEDDGPTTDNYYNSFLAPGMAESDPEISTKYSISQAHAIITLERHDWE